MMTITIITTQQQQKLGTMTITIITTQQQQKLGWHVKIIVRPRARVVVGQFLE
jgi:hypothetical protein